MVTNFIEKCVSVKSLYEISGIKMALFLAEFLPVHPCDTRVLNVFCNNNNK